MKFHFYRFLVVLFILGVLHVVSGCDLIQDIFPESDKKGKIECMVNGEDFEAAGNQSLAAMDFIIAEMQREQGTFLLTVFGVSQYQGGARAVGFKLAGNSLDEIQTDIPMEEWIYNEEIVGYFEGVMGGVEERSSKNEADTLYKASSNHASLMSLTVTAFDTLNQTISGTFQFDAEDQYNGTFVEVRNGEFSNVKWKEIGTSEN